MANLTYAEKVKKAKEAAKKRFEAKQARNKKSMGIEEDIIKTRAKKPKSSKLGSAQKSSGSKNPTSVFQNMKKKDVKKSTFFQDVIAGPKLKKKGKVDVGLSEALRKAKKKPAKSDTTTKGSKKDDKKTTKTEKFSSFGAAFKAARAKGIGTAFTYKGKKYTAVRATDIPKSIKGTASERLKQFLNMKKKKK
tara:strand:- start:549 stop:1124 length:576 start_codon:yes stop_codon:yes gene_type:complete